MDVVLVEISQGYDEHNMQLGAIYAIWNGDPQYLVVQSEMRKLENNRLRNVSRDSQRHSVQSYLT